MLTVSNSGTSGVPTVVLTSAYDASSNRTSLNSTIAGTADLKNDYTTVEPFLLPPTRIRPIVRGAPYARRTPTVLRPAPKRTVQVRAPRVPWMGQELNPAVDTAGQARMQPRIGP
jgi:hypothetical protein